MVQKLLEFLFSLDHVAVTRSTRFAVVMDAWAVPCILGAIFLALLFALIALLWTTRGEARSQRNRPAIGVISAALLLLVVLLPFSYVGALHGTIGEARFSLGLDAPEVVFGLPLVVLLVGIGVVGWLGYWSYQKQSASRGRRIALGIIRAVLLVVLLVMFCRPQLILEQEQRTRGVVAVWVDTSGSMTLEDPYNKDQAMRELEVQALKRNPLPAGQTRLTRYQLALDSLQKAKWLKALAENQDVQFFKGSAHAEEVGTAHAPDQIQPILDRLKQEKITGESTDVPTVVQEIMQRVQGTTISAIVLLTDGQTTEAGSRLDQAVAATLRTNTKIFSLPLGQEEEPFDIALEGGLQAPETAFVRDPVSVKVRLSGAGIDVPTRVKVTLYRKLDGALTELVSKEFTLDPQKKSMDAELIFKPARKSGEQTEKEHYDLVAKAEPVSAGSLVELNTKNNEVTGSTEVLDAQINALLVDRAPRWEFRYLKNELIREKTVNVSSLLIEADADFPQDGDPQVKKDGKEIFPGPITRFPETKEELDKYHVIFIGDVDPTYFSPRQQDLILDFVRKSGGGIGWIAGQQFNPESYKGTKLEPLLPIIADEADPRARVMPPVPNEPFTMVLTAAGRESNLFRFFDDPEQNAKQMLELPEMYWYKPVLGLAPAAKVLAVHPTRTQGGTPVPLIVVGRFGKGRTLFSAVEDTWRWRRYNGEPLFQSYWLQMCRLLYQGKALEQSGIVLGAESNRVEVGKPIKVTIDITDSSLLSQVPAQVPVMVMDKEGHVIETVTLQKGTGEDDQDKLSGMTTATQLGDMTLVVAPGVLPVSDMKPYEVTVEAPQREFEKTSMDKESLDTLAKKTTGAVVPLNQADALSKDIPDRGMFTIFSESEELWYKPIALVLVLVLATAEWLLRKRAGLI